MKHPTARLNKPLSRIKPLAAAIVWAGCSGFAAAQTDSEQVLTKVRVSASDIQQSSPKATAPLVDTPQTVSVIPKEVFRQQNAQNLTEVLRNTPGISFNAGENGFSTSTNNFSLRGFDTSGSVFIDGSRDSGSYGRDVFNIEQVEVVKGPASDNGRGGAGGYVNLVTKVPHLENAISGGASYGFDGYDSRERYRAAIDVNQLITDSAAFRINVMGNKGGVAGVATAENNSFGVAPSLAFGLGTATRLTLAYQHVRQNDLPDWGVPSSTVKGTFRYNPAARSADRDLFYGLKSDFDDLKSDSFTARVEHDFSDRLTLSNQTRWSKNDHSARFTPVTGLGVPTITTQTQLYQRELDTLSNLTNASFRFDTGALKHTLSTGLELTREKSDADRFGTLNSTTNLFDPNPRRVGGFPFIATESNQVEVNTVAAYVYDTVVLNEQWQVTGGLRWERYKVEIDSRNAAGTGTGAINGYEDSESSVGGKLGLVYKPAKEGSIYLSYGLSHLPGGSFLSNPDISRTGDNAFPGFVPGARLQKFTNIELGTKWEFYDERLIANAALFHTERRNVPMTGRNYTVTPLPPEQLLGYGKQIVQGIELSVAGQVTAEWSVFGGIAYMDSERKHSAFLDEARRQANPADYGTALRTSGDELAFSPKLTGNLWTTYRFPIGLTVGGGVQYVDESWIGRPDDALRIISNGNVGKLPDYTVVNLMASYELNQNVTLRFNVDNVFDEDYAISSNWGANRMLLGAARNYVLSADFSF